MERRVNYLERGQAISRNLHEHERDGRFSANAEYLNRAAEEAIFSLGALLDDSVFWDGLGETSLSKQTDAAVIRELTMHLPTLLKRLGAKEPPPLQAFVETAKARALDAINGPKAGSISAAREGLIELKSRLVGLREMRPSPTQVKDWKAWAQRLERSANAAATAITIAGAVIWFQGSTQPAELPPQLPAKIHPASPPLPQGSELKRMLSTEFIWVSLEPSGNDAPLWRRGPPE